MEEDRIDQVVLAYLKRKGYRAAELAFQSEKGRAGAAVSSDSAAEEPAMDPVIANQIYFYSRADGSGPERYRDGYGRLRSWVHTSLDQYKNELLRILYPVFMHSFMELVAKGFAREAHAFFQAFREDHEALHQKDLQVVEGLATPQHLEESEVARSLRETKLGIRMCQYSFELLLQYLHNTDSMLMLGIVNEHINLQVFPGQPSPLFQDEEAVTLTGKPQAAVDLINQKDIRWGALEDSLDDKLAKEIAANGEMGELGGKDGQGEDGKKRSSEGGKPGSSSFKKLKKERTSAGAAAAAAKGVKSEAVGSATVPRVKAELPLPTVSEEWEAQALADLRNRVRLGSNALPSVSFYSFINTHNGLNCASISADGGLVAGGFSDSSVKLWDMAKAGDGGAAAPSSERGLSNGSTKSPLRGIKGGPTMDSNSQASYRLFQGHSGPVYAANFSPDGNYLLSASADSTVRLWSLNMNANLVCYKGHNYPVWDIQYCPVGHYFASASHDRTARIWSMERTQPLRIMAGHLSDVDCVQWHVNCNYIATGSSDKTVRLWDVQTGECMRMFTGHLGMVVSLAMSPDGRYMASGDEDGAIMMWDLGSSRCVTPLMGHTGAVWTLAFSGEGSLVASGSADCTVRLWDVNSSAKLSRAEDKAGSGRRLRLLKILPTKSTPVYSLRFSRRNLLLAAGAFNVPKPTKSTDKSS